MSIKPKTNIPNLGLNVTLALPATPMLTTDEAKDLLRVNFSEDDTLIDAFIAAATLWAQKKINRAFINQTVIAEWDSVGYTVPLPYSPVSSITKIETINDEGTLTELTLNTGYHLRNHKLKVSTPLGLRATYIAGYGAASTNVPAPIKEAIGRIVINLYDRRDDEREEGIDTIAFNSLALLQHYANI